MPNKIPHYLALDENGNEYKRKALIVSELLTPEARLEFLKQNKPSIEKTVGRTCKRIFFGLPLFQSFGMTVKDAKSNPNANLLFTTGSNLKLAIAD